MKYKKPPRYFKDFPGLINKIQGLSRTAKKSRAFPGCGNPGVRSYKVVWVIGKLSHHFRNTLRS